MRNVLYFTAICFSPYLIFGSQVYGESKPTNHAFRLIEIKPGSIYENLGLRNNDELISCNGEPLANEKDVQSFFEKCLQKDGSAKLKIKRNGALKELTYNIK